METKLISNIKGFKYYTFLQFYTHNTILQYHTLLQSASN